VIPHSPPLVTSFEEEIRNKEEIWGWYHEKRSYTSIYIA
jgi:hypothetical protein